MEFGSPRTTADPLTSITDSKEHRSFLRECKLRERELRERVRGPIADLTPKKTDP